MTDPTPPWSALEQAADQLGRSGAMEPFEVAARRRRTLVRSVDGLWLGDMDTDVFEPVRSKIHLVGPWRQVQSVNAAASALEDFVKARPDLD